MLHDGSLQGSSMLKHLLGARGSLSMHMVHVVGRHDGLGELSVSLTQAARILRLGLGLGLVQFDGVRSKCKSLDCGFMILGQHTVFIFNKQPHL